MSTCIAHVGASVIDAYVGTHSTLKTYEDLFLRYVFSSGGWFSDGPDHIKWNGFLCDEV